jgi:PKD repeat protein
MSGRYFWTDMRFIALLVIVVILIAGISTVSLSDETIDFSLNVKAFASAVSGVAPLNVSFSCEYVVLGGEISKIIWDFDDGNRSSQQSVDHVFERTGQYCVILTIWVEDMFVRDMINITVFELYPPIAAIDAGDTCGKPPFTVLFTSSSYDLDGRIVNYTWDFGDGAKTTTQDAQHTYDTPGEYYVRLTVIDDDDQQGTASIQITVIENYPPVALASANDLSGKAPLTIQFYGDCENIDDDSISYLWVFSDTHIPKNQESSSQNCTHTFWIPGTYNVTLIVTDEDNATDKTSMEIVVEESMLSRLLEDFTRNFLNKHIPEVKGTILSRMITNFICNLIF